MMRFRKKVFTISLLFLLFMSCVFLIGAKPKHRTQINYRILEEGNNAALIEADPTVNAFSDQSMFRSFHSKISGTKIPKPKPPDVDFEKYIVLFISYGEKRTAGYSIEILGVTVRSGAVVVKSFLVEPPQESFQAQVITHPYLLISIPKDGYRRIELTDERGEVLDYQVLGS